MEWNVCWFVVCIVMCVGSDRTQTIVACFCVHSGCVCVCLYESTSIDVKNSLWIHFQLFDGLKETRGLDTIINQCHVISGDCSLPDLGISDDDRKLLAENVSIVYHCAATVRFDETLKRAVLLNTRGTKLVVELSKTFKKLAVSNERLFFVRWVIECVWVAL